MNRLVSSIDLHTHSTASDGTLTPQELIREADRIGLKAIALTDHDTLGGVADFISEAAHYPALMAIAGVEIAVHLGQNELHIVGLYIDPENEELRDFLRMILQTRFERNRLMIEKLNDLGYAMSMDDVLHMAGGESIGRPIIARVMVEKGYVNDIREAFDLYLRRGKCAYVQRSLPDISEVIKKIHRAGGIALWAHPANISKNVSAHLNNTLEKIVPLGIDGLESHYTTHSVYQRGAAVRAAQKYGIICSGGSDFHGLVQPDIGLGIGHGDLHVPADFLTAINDRVQVCREKYCK